MGVAGVLAIVGDGDGGPRRKVSQGKREIGGSHDLKYFFQICLLLGTLLFFVGSICSINVALYSL